jgi:hypothetical protein
MSGRHRFLAIAALAGVVAVSSALAGGGGKPFRVTSTLDGKKVLPHRIHWLGYPSLPRAQVAEVAFLIDGKVRWIEHNPPYSYGDDGNWLVTSWLAPGRHRFAVRATASDRRRVIKSIVARVLPALASPPELTGSWSREYTKAETGDGPAGTWNIVIDKTGWRIKDPAGGANWIDVAYLGPGLLETRGGIWTSPRSQQEPNVQEGNGWCEDTNQAVRFRWTVEGNGLTLALAGPKRCDGLGDFLSKTWTRVG